MTNILVRDVPDDVHQQLQRRAEQSGQSLQQYLLGQLRVLSRRPDLAEVLARIDTRSGGKVGLDQAVADLDEGRSS